MASRTWYQNQDNQKRKQGNQSETKVIIPHVRSRRMPSICDWPHITTPDFYPTHAPGDGVTDEEGWLEDLLAAPALVDHVIGHGEVGVRIFRVHESGVKLKRRGETPLYAGVQNHRLGTNTEVKYRGHARSGQVRLGQERRRGGGQSSGQESGQVRLEVGEKSGRASRGQGKGHVEVGAHVKGQVRS